jgi:hypothetical protein
MVMLLPACMFIVGLGDPALGCPVVSPGLIVKEPEATQQVINTAELAEYLTCTGDWLISDGVLAVSSSSSSSVNAANAGSAAATGGPATPASGTVLASQPLQHAALGRVVADLAALAQKLGDSPQELVQSWQGTDNKHPSHPAAEAGGTSDAAAASEVLTAAAAVAAKDKASPARAIQSFPLKISVVSTALSDQGALEVTRGPCLAN